VILHNYLNKRDDLDFEDADEVNETNDTNGTLESIEPVNAGSVVGIKKRKKVMERALAFRERE
jgi:hypothetical protein